LSLRRAIRDRRQRWLLLRARAGHEPSFRRLYRELYDPVAGYATRRIASREDAEDVISEVFHRFLKRMDQFDARRGSVWSWLMTMTRHAVIDHHRARRDHAPLEAVEETLIADAVDPLTGLVQGEEHRLLHGLLQDEDPEVREIFALRFGDGLKYREIAELLGLSEAAVKQRFSRTMRRLRREGSASRTEGDEHATQEIRPRDADEGALSLGRRAG
jgi:RNA polymerase sigma-70 factor (ECF subfamily)